MRIENTISIQARPETVWELTEAIERWPEMTPTMTALERVDSGPLGVGGQARITQPGMGTRTWTISVFEPPRHFEWSTRLGPMTMTASHAIEPTGEGCDLTLTLVTTGPGSTLLGWLSRRSIRKALATENEGFRTAAEARESG